MKSNESKVFLGLFSAAVLYCALGGPLPGVDLVNAAFHRAGHLFFGLYGGVVAQLLFPVWVGLRSALRGNLLGIAIGTSWLGQNLIDIGRFMSDARTQALHPLLECHNDWTTILKRWDLLPWDRWLGASVGLLGFALMLAVGAVMASKLFAPAGAPPSGSIVVRRPS